MRVDQKLAQLTDEFIGKLKEHVYVSDSSGTYTENQNGTMRLVVNVKMRPHDYVPPRVKVIKPGANTTYYPELGDLLRAKRPLVNMKKREIFDQVKWLSAVKLDKYEAGLFSRTCNGSFGGPTGNLIRFYIKKGLLTLKELEDIDFFNFMKNNHHPDYFEWYDPRKHVHNPFEPGTWGFRFWNEGYDNPELDNPYTDNEFASENFSAGQEFRKQEIWNG